MRLIAAVLLVLAQAAGLSLPGQTRLQTQLAPAHQPEVHLATVPLGAIPGQIGSQPPVLTATSAYAVDVATMTPLYQLNPNQALPIASLTKLITVLVVLHDHTPSDAVTVGHLPAYTSDDETLGLEAGQRFHVRDLVAASLISSDDDAADALGIFDSGSTAKFTVKMNHFASALGLTNIHFNSSSGLSDVGNYATARDLAIIGRIVLESPTMRTLIGQPSLTITDGQGQAFALTSTDDLLANNAFSGIKTGYTDAAGQCFVGLTSVNGHQIITVVLHSSDRFGDSATLRDWVARNWQWPQP